MDNRTWALVLACFLMACSVSAEEKGTFDMTSSWIRDYDMMKHLKREITVGTLVGTTTVLESSGGPFVAGSHNLSRCLVYASKSEEFYLLDSWCIITDKDKDKLYIFAGRLKGDTEVGGGGKGRWFLQGGTGKYSGISGECDYDVEYLGNDRVINMTDGCTWQKPGS